MSAKIRDTLLAAADDAEIEQHRRRVEYEQKQKAEDIQMLHLLNRVVEGMGGCSSISGERWHQGRFLYGRQK